MKTIKFFTILSLFAFAFTSCDEIDELTEVTVNADESVDITTTVPENSTDFSQTATISVDDEDVRDNLDRIESVTINSLTYQFINVSGNEDAVISGTISLAGGSVTFTDVNPTTAQGQTFTISDTTAINAFATAIRNGASVTVTLDGTAENAPVTFTVRISADMTIVVDVI